MSKRHACLIIFAATLLSWSLSDIHAFTPIMQHRPIISAPKHTKTKTALLVGVGVANTYSWKEEQFEIEVKVPVPEQTSAKDIKFTCSSDSIDLLLINNSSQNHAENKIVLLDGTRKMRGKICVDGTFWSIDNNANNKDGEKQREVTISIEKHFAPISSVGGTQTYDTLTDFDWGGVYPNDDDEVSYRKYDEAEELNVREYAAKLGVDIDNIDMTKVNKTMFGAGLREDSSVSAEELDKDSNSDGFHFNITQTTLDQLAKVGLAKEIVQQGDGSEYELCADDSSVSINERKKFLMLGKDVSVDELRTAGIMASGGRRGNSIPTMWDKQTIPVEEAPGYQKTFDVGNSFVMADGIIEHEVLDHGITFPNDMRPKSATGEEETVEIDDSVKEVRDVENAVESHDSSSIHKDPIDMLTVVRLKEILREQGLKASGTKQVLRDRLRTHVHSLLQEG